MRNRGAAAAAGDVLVTIDADAVMSPFTFRSMLLAEDLDFARRLRAHGKRTGRRFTTMRAAPIVVSCRKVDRYIFDFND